MNSSTSNETGNEETAVAIPLKPLRLRAEDAVAAAKAERDREAEERREIFQNGEIRDLVRLVETWWEIAIPPHTVTTEPRGESLFFNAYAVVDGFLVTCRDGYHGSRLHLAYRCPTCQQVQISADCNQLTALADAMKWYEDFASGRTPCPDCELRSVKAEPEEPAPTPRAPKIDDGGDAFPSSEGGAGLTARDYFAAKAMALSSISWGTGFTPDDCKIVSVRAYAIADALLAYRKGAK